MTLTTKAEYARSKGWDKSYLSQESVVAKLKTAMEPHPKNPKRELVNVEKADEIFGKTRDPQAALKKKGEAPTAGEDESYSSAKRDLTRLNIEEAQIKLAKLKGQLLNRQEVLDAFAKYGQSIRDQVLAMARPLSEVAAGMTDSREIKAEFEKQAKQIFETIANDLSRQLNKPEGDGTTAH